MQKQRVPIMVLLIAILLPFCASITFSEYAFWFPDIQPPVTIVSCAGLEIPVMLTPVAAQKPGFDGIVLAKRALQKMESARKLANVQKSPLFWGGANLLTYEGLSLMCHQQATGAIQDAVAGVNANWHALDTALAQADNAGITSQGPSRAIFGQLQKAQEDIQTRNSGGNSAGAAFVRALLAVQEATKNPAMEREAVIALIGLKGLLETQVRALEAVEGLPDAVAQENRKTTDQVTQTITEGKRLQKELQEEKASLVPEHVFSLQTATFAQTGSVQDFASSWRQSGQELEDAVREMAQSIDTWKKKEKNYALVSRDYLENAKEHATNAKNSLASLKRQTENLEKDLLKKTDETKIKIHQRISKTKDGTFSWQLEMALAELNSPLSATRGERILQLANRLGEANRALLAPENGASIQSDLETLINIIAAAEKDGINMGQEKKTVEALNGLFADKPTQEMRIQTNALAESVEEKISTRFSTLLERAKNLEMYAGFIELPAIPTGTYSENAGNWAEFEKKVDSLERKANAGAPKWIGEQMEKTADIQTDATLVLIGLDSTRTITAAYINRLLFGTDLAVHIDIPKQAENRTRLESQTLNMAVGKKTITFMNVKPGQRFEVVWNVEGTPVRLTSFKETVKTARLSGLWAAAEWTLASDAEQKALIEHDFEHPIDQVSGPFVHEIIGSTLRTILELKKGANVVTYFYRVPEPVFVTKQITNEGWTYLIQNTLSLGFTLDFSMDEKLACPAQSPDVRITDLGHGYARMQTNVELLAKETRTFRVFLNCPIESLGNQSMALQIPASMDASKHLAWERAQTALNAGNFDTAATLLLQLQQPLETLDPLKRLKQFQTLDSTTHSLYERGVSAKNRNDAVLLSRVQNDLEDHLSTLRKSLELRVSAVCQKCPATVNKILKNAQSDLFLEKYAEAQNGMIDAEKTFAAYTVETESEKKALEDALVKSNVEDFSIVQQFQDAFDVPSGASRWRSDNTGYSQAKKALDSLEKYQKELAGLEKKNAEEKPVTAESVFLALEKAIQEKEKLQEAVKAENTKADNAVILAEKAFQQFGTPADAAALQQAKDTLTENRFTLAHYFAQKLSDKLQHNPTSANTTANLAEWGIGLGALMALGALAWHFRKPEKPLEEL